MILLETERLRLRNLKADDADAMFDYRNNEICARFQRGQTKDREGIEKLIERRSQDELSAEKPAMIAVALKETDEMIGEIVVMTEDDTISLGYTFSYKYHRRGYAFEALSALIDILHGMAADREFISFTEPENTASMALLRKLGYIDLGYVPSMSSQAFGKWVRQSTIDEFAASGGEKDE